jgi:proteasome lid subunit RPN8/RPN11
MIILSPLGRRAIEAHGEADFPYECCGFLIGRFEGERKIVDETIPVSNAREESVKRTRFLITPEEFSRAAAHAKAGNREIVGFYHSHPDHPAQASRYDCEHAWPVFSYIIVSVIGGKAADMLSWELMDDRSGFREETIVEGEP